METNTRHFTLVFIIDEDQKKILLGLKKRGFGKNYWNGFGGKVEPGEEYHKCAEREVKEECGLDVVLGKRLAQIVYTFSNNTKEVLISHIYRTSIYSGEVKESEEMQPKWWPLEEIPFDRMWADSPLWYEYMIKEEPFEASYSFDPEHKIIQGFVKRSSADT